MSVWRHIAAGREGAGTPPGPVRVKGPLSTATMLHHRFIISVSSFICKSGERAVRSLFGGVGFHKLGTALCFRRMPGAGRFPRPPGPLDFDYKEI